MIASCELTVLNNQCEHPATVRRQFGAGSKTATSIVAKERNEYVHDDT